jgi:hypothetical protein
MPKYLSGRFKKTPQSALPADRYKYLSPADTEPNLGDPIAPGELPPSGQQYQIVSVEGYPGERYWIPVGGGIIPGSISVFNESNLVGGLSSTTQLNFTGLAITAIGNRTGLPNPGIAVTISVFAPGNNGELLFNSSNDFSTSSKLTFNSTNGLLNAGDRINVGTGGTVLTTTGVGSVGIGTTNPTQELHVQGDIRLTGTIYDYLNNPGNTTNILAKNVFGGLTWIDQSTIRSGAGGTYQNVQFNNNVGLVDGAPNFVYDDINSRVGIGSTLPSVLLDVLGSSKFTGSTIMSQLNVTGVTTTQTLSVSGTSTTRNLQVSGITTLGILSGTNAYFTGIVTASKFSGSVDLTDLYVAGVATIGTLKVTGLTTTQNFQVYQSSNLNHLKVTGITTFDTQVNINNLNVTGISTLDNIKIDTNTVSTLTGNLILDSFGGTTQINDSVYVNDSTNSTSKDTGSIITEGGVGIEKNLYVGGETRLATSGGITTTGGDLYVSGNLYVGNDISYDEVNARRGTFSEYLQTKDFTATGISTFNILTVTGISSFNNNVTFGDSSSDSVTFKAFIDSTLIPTTNNTYNIGNLTNRWNTVYATSFNGSFIGNADTATYATNAGISTNIKGGAAGSIPYQSSKDNTTFVSVGTPGSVLTSNGSAPTWSTPSSVTVGKATYADNAGISTNIKGGAAGSIPYQSGNSSTTFVSVGATGFVLTSNGSVPIWSTPSSVTVGIASYATKAGIATNIEGGTTGSIPYQSGNSSTTFVSVGAPGSVLTSNGSAPVWSPPSSVSIGIASYADNAGISTNIKGGTTGSIPYQSGISSTTFVSVGTPGSVLTSNGSAPVWSPPSSVSIGIASYAVKAGIATNIEGGAAGSIPYQSGISSTTFVSVGTPGSVLTSNGSIPVWTSSSSVSIGIASYAVKAGIATNIEGGSSGSIPYQSGISSTTFVSVGTPGSVLTSNGSIPIWSTPSSVTVGIASYAVKAGIATNIEGGVAGSIPYQSGNSSTTFVSVGSSGSVLTLNGTIPTWTSPSSVTVGIASYATKAGIATNIEGGVAGSIPYQSGNSSTTFVSVGSSGSVLTLNGTVPVWSTSSSVSVGIASYAANAGISTNIKGGVAGSIPYQSGNSSTTFVSVGSSGSVLTLNGTVPVWSPSSSLSINVSISTNTTNSNQLIPYVASFGSVSGLGATNTFVFNPSTKRLGIGIANPSSSVHIAGDLNLNSNFKVNYPAGDIEATGDADSKWGLYLDTDMSPSNTLKDQRQIAFALKKDNGDYFPTVTIARKPTGSGYGMDLNAGDYNVDLGVSGNLYVFGSSNVSDINLKKNIELIHDPLEKIMQLEGVSFEWKNNNQKSLGIIAQNIEQVLPELVSTENTTGNNWKAVNYNGLIGLLIECVKQQQVQIDDLKKSINPTTP